jgi:HPt (histidine-containing phosphotransfer) domain-containing protein
VDGFAREGGRLLECIRVALVQGDHGAFVDAVQALKGSAGDLGARPVAQLCERVQEVPAERLGSPRVLLLVEALARTFEATCVDLTEYLQRRRDAVR